MLFTVNIRDAADNSVQRSVSHSSDSGRGLAQATAKALKSFIADSDIDHVELLGELVIAFAPRPSEMGRLDKRIVAIIKDAAERVKD